MSDTTLPRTDDRVLHERPLVPTPRQLEVGDVHDAPTGPSAPVPPTPEGRSLRAAIAAWARSADPRAVHGPRLPLLVLGLSSLLATWDDAALGIIAPELRAEFGISIGFLATLSSAVAIAGTALALPFGYLADRVKRVWIVRVGSIVTNAASIGQGLAPGIGSLVGARFAAGLGLAATEPASFALMTDYYASRYRSRVFSFLYAAAQIGAVLGPLVAGFLVLRYGWRAGVVALGVLATIVAVLTFFLWEPVRGRHEREEAGAPPDEIDEEQDPVGFAEAWRAAASITTLRRIWFARPLLFLKGFATVGLFSLYFGEVWVLSPGQRGAIFSFHAVVTLIGLVTLAPAADRLLQRTPGRFLTLAGAILVVQAGGFVVMGFAPNVTTAIVASVPIATIDAMLAPAFFALISQVVPPRIRGLGLQTIKPWDLLGIVAFPFVASLLDGGLGLHRGMAVFAIPMLIAAAILGSAAPGVERDIRAARAAAMADQAARRARASGLAAALTIRDLHVGYDGVDVLFGVDLDIDDGEFVALVGTNGAGKSTLLRAIAGLQPASGGAVFLDTRDTTYLPAHQVASLGVTMVPGGRAVFPDLTVSENLRTAAWLVPVDEIDERVQDVLARFPELRELLARRAGSLSGGQQQMVALGQAFVTRPRVLLIDELSLGLAPAIVDRLLEALRDLHATGVTIVVVEQSLNVASAVAERAVFMEKGTVRFTGAMDDLLARPDLVRSVFLGGGLGGGTRGAPTARQLPGDAGVPALEVRDVAVRFGGVPALDGVDLRIAPGEVLGIIGPNGAGKTTLFDVISGFTAPERGQVLLDGVDVSGQPVHARARMGLARSFQSARLFGALTVRETVASVVDRHDEPSALTAAAWLPSARTRERRALQRADDLLDLLGLGELADRFVSELSTGSRRIVDVACTLARRPRVLLLDEPSTGLAQAETEALGRLLTRVVRETGCAVALIEHDLPLVSSVSHRLLALELGRPLATGAPTDVLEDPEVLRAYLTASEDVVHRSGARIDAITAALTTTTPDRE